MTNIKIVYEQEKALVEVKGHTEYEDEGYDIVCAGISVVCQNTINLLDNLGYNVKDNLKCENGYIKFITPTKDNVSLTIIKTLEETLRDIASQYPKFVKLK